MCKLISFVCVLTLALAATSYGAGVVFDPMFAGPPPTMLVPGNPHADGVLVADWEHSYDTAMVGWGDILLGFDTVGATLNGNALKLIGPAGSWAWALSLKLDGWKHSDYTKFDGGPKQVCPSGYDHNEDFLNWLLDNCDYNIFQMDVSAHSTKICGVLDTWVEDTDPATDPYDNIFIVVNTGGYDDAGNWGGLWIQEAGIPITLSAEPTHCVWDIAAAKQATIDLFQTYCNDRYFEIFIIGDNGGYTGCVSYFLDNAMIKTPEPATIALLGLGGLSLIRRKR